MDVSKILGAAVDVVGSVSSKTDSDSPDDGGKKEGSGKTLAVVGGVVSAVLGVATGGTFAIIAAVLPVVINLVAGMFKDHSPEFYFDNGLDKMRQYMSGNGGDKGWLQTQINHARIGVKGLIAKKREDYAGGAVIYYLPMLAFPINFKGEVYEGDTDLQKIACALYVHGVLPSKNMYFPVRPEYKITDGIEAIKASDWYKHMVDEDIDGAAEKAESDKINDTINTTTAKAKTLLQKYWYVLLIIPVAFVYRLIFGRK